MPNQKPRRKPNARRNPSTPRPNGKSNARAIESDDGAGQGWNSENPLDGLRDEISELAAELPTMLLVVHAAFTAQHLIGELRYHWEMGNLTRGDREMIAQLGKEIAEELEKEN